MPYLISVATPLLGNPMLYSILDAAKDWIEENRQKIEQSLQNKTDIVCKFFLQGKCRFGIHCINIHPGASAQSETNSSPESETQSTVPNTKHKSTKKDSSPSKIAQKSPVKITTEETEDTKKERMRTATEVISRILWDPDLPPEDFVVGYLDRFIGIQEKGFKDFSWEDISTVGADVLAVPKHRIQYFKYKGKIVWDKRSQTDDFFGSRGGKTIDMIVDKPADTTDPKGDLEISTDDVVGVEIDLIDNDIGDEQPLAHRHGNQPRPTHFVCLRVTAEEVKAKVKKVVDHIVKLNPQLAECTIKTPSLHVTLCMIQLLNDKEIETAKRVFQSCQLQFLSVLPRCMKIEFTGVGNFRERLIYIKVKSLPGLSKFVFHIIEQFQLAGLKTPGNRDEYTPHITLIKLSRPMQQQLDTKLINPECYRPFLATNLGCQTVTCIHLCAMHAPAQADGFYLKHGTITNSLIGLPGEFVRFVEDKLIQLTAKGFMEDTECKALVCDLHEAVSQVNEAMFDDVIKELVRYNYEATMFRTSSLSSTTVIIMRGLPGSGKSCLSSNCQESASDPSQVTVISADLFFTDGSDYQFNPVTAFKAHQLCIVRFLEAICAKKKLVIIDNTNSQQWEYIIYTYLCEVLSIQCHIVEIPCPSQSMAERFRYRNQHKIQAPAIARMLQRWEEDNRAIIVAPSLAYPRDWTNVQPFSILRLCEGLFVPLPETIKASSDLVAVYSGIFLTSNSQWEVLSTFRPSLYDIHASHVTLTFNPDISNLRKLSIGKKVKVRITGHAENSKTQACVVDIPLSSENKTPHITISTAEGISPKSTNIMLQNQIVRSCDTKVVEGIVGIVIRQVTDEEKNGEDVPSEKIASMASYVVTSSSDLKAVLPCLMNDVGTGDSAHSTNEPQIDIVTCEQNITKLFVFDFDGTLANSPGPMEGRKMYEQVSGRKWPHKGWLGWPESLSPPIRILPGPALAEFHNHIDRANSYTIILTGRVTNTKPGFMKVLENFQIFPDKVYFKPDITDEHTCEFKVRIIKQLLEREFSNVTFVKFWDDLSENLWSVNWLSQNPTLSHVQFDIIDATEMNLALSVSKRGKKISLLKTDSQVTKNKYESSLQECLSARGNLPTPIYHRAAQQGIELIADQFSKLVGYEGNPLDLIYLFGSYPLKRVSDVDMCLLAPSSHTNIEWIEKMASRLESCGVKFVHIGRSSRCPRLKILLMYSETAPIEYDMVIALIPKDELFTNPPKEQLPASKVAQMRKTGDNVSKVSLSGPLFMEKIAETLEQSVVSHESFGAVVEMMVQILIANREKGNAYHCIRTFHIVQLLVDFIQENGLMLTIDSNCDVLFKQFVCYITEIQYEQWQKLFGEFVPEAYIPRIMTVFKNCLQLLKPLESFTVQNYEDLLQRTDYPLEKYIPLDIKISGQDSILKWKAGIMVEARLPSYVRQMISHGLDVRPDGNVKNYNKYSFSVPPLKSAKDTLQQILRPFWVEFAELRKQGGLIVQLNFDQPTTTSSSPALDALIGDSNKEPKTAEILEQLTHFASQVSSKDAPKQLHLPSSLTSHARLLVHEAAERLGLQHSSVGTGKNRHVVLEKRSN